MIQEGERFALKDRAVSGFPVASVSLDLESTEFHPTNANERKKNMTTITTKLDYQTILANQGRPVNLTIAAKAPSAVSEQRKPIAFAISLDRSGSMHGRKLEQAKEACRGVIDNLRPEDFFGLVVFDQVAQVVLPLRSGVDKARAKNLVNSIYSGGSTNLGGGWALARDELEKAPEGATRRMLLLSDGQANVGLVDPVQLSSIAGDGLDRVGVRTSCLGFGDDYNEDLMSEMANASTGNFYDVASADKLPEIFEAELDGILGLVAQNLRVRVKPETFCDEWASLGETPGHRLPDGRVELKLGDLVSEEERSFALAVRVEPIPLGADGSQVCSLEGEKLMSLEFLYDEITADKIVSRRDSRLIRIKATQNPDEVTLDESVLPIVSAQQAAETIRRTIGKMDRNRFDEALRDLEDEAAKLRAHGRPELVKDGLAAIERAIRNHREGWRSRRGRKTARYDSRSLRRRSSREHWSGDESQRPSFKEPRPE